MSESPSWDEVKALLGEVLEIPPGTRRAYIDAACRDKPALKARVEELLASHEEAEDFLEEPVFNAAEIIDSDPAAALVGRRVGPFTVRSVIAAGGMGIVYEAQQDEPRRPVALKVMRQGIGSRSALRRFKYEAQILGRLRHPHIAEIYEAGTHSDPELPGGGAVIPYFAMEYIAGAIPITEYVQQPGLSIEDRLRLFIPVADAVHHGHQKGIIHRDLKPANILVDSAGRPKVIDFGVARATDSDLAVTTQQTQIGQLVGTMQYMSPEQCQGDPHDLDIRSDVYALGVVLYQVLTGSLPYELPGTTIMQATEQICATPPRKLSSVNTALRGDIETITLKALEKNRNQRYQSAADLARDIERYLAHEPITARPASLTYQFGRFVKRHTVLVRAAAAVIVVVIASVIALGIMLSRTLEAQADAEAKARETDAAVDFLADTINDVTPREASTPLIVPGTLFATVSEKADVALARYPNARARMKIIAATAFNDLNDAASARRTLRAALEINGLDPDVRASVLAQYGRLHYLDNDFALALERYEESLAVLAAEYPADDRRVIGAESKVWLARDYLGQQAAAEDHFRRVVEICRTRADMRGRLPRALNDLGRCLQRQGRYDDAGVYLLAALKELPAEDVDDVSDHHARANGNVGKCLLDAGSPNVAAPYLETAVQKLAGKLGPQHASVLKWRYMYARSLHEQGLGDRAIVECRAILDAMDAADLTERTKLPTTGLLASLLLDDGQRVEAAQLTRRCHAEWEQVRAAEQMKPAPTRAVKDFYERIVVGRCFLDLGEPALARPYLEEAHVYLSAYRIDSDRYRVMAKELLDVIEALETGR